MSLMYFHAFLCFAVCNQFARPMNARRDAPRVAVLLTLIGLVCVVVRYEHRRRASLEGEPARR